MAFDDLDRVQARMKPSVIRAKVNRQRTMCSTSEIHLQSSFPLVRVRMCRGQRALTGNFVGSCSRRSYVSFVRSHASFVFFFVGTCPRPTHSPVTIPRLKTPCRSTIYTYVLDPLSHPLLPITPIAHPTTATHGDVVLRIFAYSARLSTRAFAMARTCSGFWRRCGAWCRDLAVVKKMFVGGGMFAGVGVDCCGV